MKWIEINKDLVNLNNVKYIEKYCHIGKSGDIYEIIVHFADSDNLVMRYKNTEDRDKAFEELRQILIKKDE